MEYSGGGTRPREGDGDMIPHLTVVCVVILIAALLKAAFGKDD
jgi:hypothetical protein